MFSQKLNFIHRESPLLANDLALSHVDPLIAASGILESDSDPMIGVNSFGSGTYSVSLAQYQLDSIESTKQKLAQFPKGTRFIMQLNGSDAPEMTRVATDLKSVLDEYGMKIAGCRFWQGVPADSELPNASPESPCHSLPTFQDTQHEP